MVLGQLLDYRRHGSETAIALGALENIINEPCSLHPRVTLLL